MTSAFLPRRSCLYLYVPASNARAVVKVARLPIDVLDPDLEDSLAPDPRLAAREWAAPGDATAACG